MSNKKVQALRKIAEGILDYADALCTEESKPIKTDVINPPVKEDTLEKPVKKEPEKAKTSIPAPEKAKTSIPAPEKSTPVQEPSKEKSYNLDEMDSKELRALAKDMGIKIPFGTSKEKLIATIRKEVEKESAVEVSEPEEKSVEKKEAELPVDKLMEQIKAETEDMSDDDIRELLEEAEISGEGRRSALLSKLYNAVKEGKINFSDDDEEVSDGENEEEEVGDTPERSKAIETFISENRESFERGELDVGEMKEFLKENFGITIPKKATPTEVFDAYMDKAVNFIDDNGNTIEEGFYLIHGNPFCCGVPLDAKQDEEKEKLFHATCSVCGETYDIEVE